ncbi:hypothetical protein BaRGS_00021626 [Batillaria attramentaria]|uniref:VPS33B-interacting protein in apical-basolateral polarity regulator n=1 Tax=Batillaria attramentaria TaxID=370345 RepID=A0ABD0KJF0_9CAEN
MRGGSGRTQGKPLWGDRRGDIEDDEEYTGRSKSAAKKNIFDDDVSIEAAKKIITSSKFGADDDFEEDAEIIGIDGNTAVRYVPSPAYLRSNPPAPEPKHSFGSFQKAAGLGHVRSHSLTIAPQKSGGDSFPKISMVSGDFHSAGSSSSLSIEDAVGSGGRKGPQDMEQMQQEIQLLKRRLLAAKRERWTKLPVELTLRRIMKGEPYSLEPYRALEDKLALLDQAVALMDGNAITAAVLHLRATVKRSTFQHELLLRPVAANHFLSFLRGHYDHVELVDTLSMLGRTEEAAIVKYQQACNSRDASTKVSMLKTCLRAHFQADPTLSGDAALVRQHVDLLERQRPIEDSDARLEAEGRTRLFQEFPRRRSLVDMPVTTTLFYCCLYHYHQPENNFASPLALKKNYELPERQYVWTALSARAKARGWTDIELLLTSKGWFGGKKMKAAIGFDKVVEILYKFQAPPDILTKYLELVDDLETRLNLSRKTGCRKVTIETLIKMKDRAGVEEFARKHSGTLEGQHALSVLRDETIRWK